MRYFTDSGLERHLLGKHSLVTSSMQDAANANRDGGRCPLCGKVENSARVDSSTVESLNNAYRPVNFSLTDVSVEAAGTHGKRP